MVGTNDHIAQEHEMGPRRLRDREADRKLLSNLGDLTGSQVKVCLGRESYTGTLSLGYTTDSSDVIARVAVGGDNPRVQIIPSYELIEVDTKKSTLYLARRSTAGGIGA